MRARSLSQIFAAAMVMTLAAYVALQGQNTAAKPVTLAVVDVQKIFSTIKEKSEMEAEITRQTEQVQKEEQDRKQKLNDLQQDLSVLAPESDAFKQTQEKLEKQAIEFQTWKQFTAQKLEREKTIRIEQLYLKVVDAVGRKAQRDGFDVVLFKDETEKLRGQNQQQLAAIIQTRKVLYAAPQLDVTDQLIQMLDNEYNNRGKNGKK